MEVKKRAFLWYEMRDLLIEAKENRTLIIDSEQKYFRDLNSDFKIKPPLLYNIKNESSVEEYLENLQICENLCFLIVLIQAGAAAVGIWHEGEFIQHKALSAYMVRKKQGKNQLTHLNKKGKSRQGSRIRLNNTIRFFENINTKLEEWQDDIDLCDILFFSCTPRMWGEVFRSKVVCPIEREDKRWNKVPMDVQVPNFKELQRVAYKITNGIVIHDMCVDV